MNAVEKCQVCGGSGLDGRYETIEPDGSRHGTYASCIRCRGSGDEADAFEDGLTLEQQQRVHRGEPARRGFWAWATTYHPYYTVVKTNDGERLYPRQAPWCFLYRAGSRAVRRLWFHLRYRPSHFVESELGFNGWLYVEAKPRWWYRAQR